MCLVLNANSVMQWDEEFDLDLEDIMVMEAIWLSIQDLWCENQSLEDAFPNLFNLAVNKEGWVAEDWEEDGVRGSWGLRFNRHLNDWEVGEVESLLSKLHPLTIRSGVDDLLWWRENKNGTFSIKSFYDSFSRGTRPPFLARVIWTPWVPIRASFFGWEVAWSRLVVIDCLKRSGWNIPNRCYLCKNEEETTNHLLLFCEKARMLWLLIFSLFGVQWVMHFSVRRNLLGWHGSFVGKKREKAWRAAPSACCGPFGKKGIGEPPTILVSYQVRDRLVALLFLLLCSLDNGRHRNPLYGDTTTAEQYVTEEHYVLPAMAPQVESSSSPSGGLACAIAALAERQQMGGESSTNYNGNMPAFNMPPGSSRFSNRDDGEWGVDRGSEVAEAGTSYASSDATDEAGGVAALPPTDEAEGSFQNVGGPIVPESFEEQMMLAMAVSLAEARARTSTQGVWQ
ncbi:hypothetical protein CK203_095780 [Vitis vinifera]|uniref:Reverse transcriptase zinc-binding domain-containing protein n=1 Tax=Vitis vinifera TaxID=29760 RepID=A0A438DL54_VITVI|nr:hypothetical protein CK203_095780 [Vitis vinifera]